MSAINVQCHGKRYTTKVAPMAKFATLIPSVLELAGLTGTVDPQACVLTYNGKPVDLGTPMRFANVPSGAKVELRTGKEPVLGVHDKATPIQPARPAEPSSSAAQAAQSPSTSAAPTLAAPAQGEAPTSAPALAAAPPQPALPDNAASLVQTGIVDPDHPSHAIFGRAVHVFARQAEAEAAAASSAEVPEDEVLYEVTEADVRTVMAGYAAKRAKEERGLATKQMREAEEARRAAACPPVTIRVELPDDHVLQARFAATAPLQELRDLVHKALTPAAAAAGFHLFITPPKEVLRDMAETFYGAHLAPAARVHAGMNAAHVGELLRPEVLALLGPPPARELRASGRGQGQGGSSATGAAAAAGASGSGAGAAAAATEGRRPGAGVPGGPKWLKLGK